MRMLATSSLLLATTAAPVLAEPPPYAVSRGFAVETVPTAVLVDPTGSEKGRIVGWSAAEVERLTGVPAPGAGPDWKPGCEARTTPGHDLVAASTGDEIVCRAGAIAFDVRDDRLVRHIEGHVGIDGDFLAFCGHLDVLVHGKNVSGWKPKARPSAG